MRVVPYGEADAVLTLFTERLGRVAALARGARKSGKRLAGVLDPMHTLKVALDERPGAELLGVHESDSREQILDRCSSPQARLDLRSGTHRLPLGQQLVDV